MNKKDRFAVIMLIIIVVAVIYMMGLMFVMSSRFVNPECIVNANISAYEQSLDSYKVSLNYSGMTCDTNCTICEIPARFYHTTILVWLDGGVIWQANVTSLSMPMTT